MKHKIQGQFARFLDEDQFWIACLGDGQRTGFGPHDLGVEGEDRKMSLCGYPPLSGCGMFHIG